MNPIDPITLGVIWGGLQSITVEVGTTVPRTAHSQQARTEGIPSPFAPYPGPRDGQGSQQPVLAAALFAVGCRIAMGASRGASICLPIGLAAHGVKQGRVARPEAG